MSRNELFDNPAFLSDLADTTQGSRAIAKRWGVGKTSINNYRAKNGIVAVHAPDHPITGILRGEKTVTETSDGARTVEAIRDRPVTLQDARDWIAATGDNPDDYTLSIRSIAYGDSFFSNRMSAVPKFKKAGSKPLVSQEDFDKASKFIEGFTYIPSKKEFLVDSVVIVPSDEQLGKVDFNGGTDSTVERAMNSYAEGADYLKEYRPRQTLLAHAGDNIENTCSTNSQRDTNDLDVPHQILTSYKLDLAGLQMLAPLTGELISAYVPSNHGRWRTGLKQDAGDPHADFGITNAKQIAHSLEAFGGYDNVKVMWPEPLMESMTVHMDTVNVGIVHGHQAGGPDKLGDWWSKQDHGRMPTWDADVLIAGHFHSYRAYQSGDARWVFVGPANEPGSSWYSNLKGARSTSGMLAMSFVGKNWFAQRIL